MVKQAGSQLLITGRILVRDNIITQEQLDNAIKTQRQLKDDGTRKLIGEIIVEQGYCPLEAVKRAVDELHKGKRGGEKVRDDFYKHFMNGIIEKVGEDKYHDAVLKKADAKDRHIIKTLNDLGVMTFQESCEVLRNIIKALGRDKIIVDYEDKEILLSGGRIYFCKEGESRIMVTPVYYPRNTVDIQILVPYDKCINLSLETAPPKTEEKNDIVNFSLRDMVEEARRHNASDIHIVPKKDRYRVFFRIDGRFIEMKDFYMNLEQGLQFTSLLRTNANDFTKGGFNPDETRVSQAAKIELEDMGVGLRLELVPDGRLTEHMDTTIRILSQRALPISSNMKSNLLNLGFLESDAVSVEAATHRKFGVGVISGVVNSGKSTTVLNILPALDPTKKIGTVEDPIECILDRPNIIQHQIFEPPNDEDKKKMGFEQYIKSFKRGDYDVVFIGEWRKTEGLTEAMIEQSNAGQLIFTTLHIKSSFEIYSAIEEMFHVPKHVSARLIFLSLNQLLLPRLCEHCKEENEIGFTQHDVKYLNALSKIEKDELIAFTCRGFKRNKKGCGKCHAGYKGRTVIYDYFIPTQEFISEVVNKTVNPTDIKNEVLKNDLGKTKKIIFLERLKDGLVEKSRVGEI